MGRREEYLADRLRMMRLSTLELEDLMSELGKKRFDENDISVENEFRIASSVYIQRTKKGGTLVFHLRNFLGALVFSIIVSMFIIYNK